MTTIRQVLTTVEQINEQTSNEIRGFLSEKYGLLPKTPPLLQLPETHQRWDEIAQDFSHCYKRQSLRRILTSLPVLDANTAALPDEYLLRGATLLGLFAHAYVWLQPGADKELPKSIRTPWSQISQRLNREYPSLYYQDLILYNWQYKNPNDKRRCFENFDLLVETVGREEERIFYMVQLDMAACSTPLIGSFIRAQEAITDNNCHHLYQEINLITQTIQKIDRSFALIHQNPYHASYCNPVIWGKEIAPLAVAISPEVEGPSGTSAPYFHLLDSFIGREAFKSKLGKDQRHFRKYHHPPNLKKFIAALEKISVWSFIQKSGDNSLKDAFNNLVNNYISTHGLLGNHRRKVFGYLTTSFKVGRMVTVGGNTAGSSYLEKPWRHVDTLLGEAIQERHHKKTSRFLHAPIKRKTSITSQKEDNANVQHIVFDICNTGIQYQPGDICQVLPQSSDALIKKTLSVLDAKGDEPIYLSYAWRKAIDERYALADQEFLPLYDFLRFGRIRALSVTPIETLYKLSHLPQLKETMATYTEDQWELWELLDLVKKNTILNLNRFLLAKPWEEDSICFLVEPILVRNYSISSTQSENPDEISITVSPLKYTEAHFKSDNESCYGTASYYLQHIDLLTHEKAMLYIHPSFQFRLPQNSNAPIVMFAGGSGISPFMAFIKERIFSGATGENWLFLATKSQKGFLYQEELIEWAKQKKIFLVVVFSREDCRIEHAHPGKLKKCQARHIDEVLQEENYQVLLQELLAKKSKGGKEAYFYIAGAAEFEHAIEKALATVIAKKQTDQSEDDSSTTISRLYAEKRLMIDVFTSMLPAVSPRETLPHYTASEVLHHNNDEAGYWFIIDDTVYDVTSYLNMHPGGDALLRHYAGIDATEEYKQVGHHLDPSAHAVLNVYKIGFLKRLDFGHSWNIYVSDKGFSDISLQESYEKWLRYLYLATEINNGYTVENDVIVQINLNNIDDYYHKLLLIRNAHFAFYEQSLLPLFSERLSEIVAIFFAFCVPEKSSNDILKKIDPELIAINQVNDSINLHINKILKDELFDIFSKATGTTLIETVAQLSAHNTGLLKNLSNIFIQGLRYFEEHTCNVITKEKASLVKLLEKIPDVICKYHRDIEKTHIKIAIYSTPKKFDT